VTIGKGKRPRDPNQLAKWIVDRSTSDDPRAKAGTRANSNPSREYLTPVEIQTDPVPAPAAP